MLRRQQLIRPNNGTGLVCSRLLIHMHLIGWLPVNKQLSVLLTFGDLDPGPLHMKTGSSLTRVLGNVCTNFIFSKFSVF